MLHPLVRAPMCIEKLYLMFLLRYMHGSTSTKTNRVNLLVTDRRDKSSLDIVNAYWLLKVACLLKLLITCTLFKLAECVNYVIHTSEYIGSNVHVHHFVWYHLFYFDGFCVWIWPTHIVVIQQCKIGKWSKRLLPQWKQYRDLDWQKMMNVPMDTVWQQNLTIP